MIIQVGIIEDDKRVQAHLTSFWETQKDLNLLFMHDSVESALNDRALVNAQVLLLDIGLNGMSGLDGIRPLKQKNPKVEIIMLTNFEDADHIFKALCAGAIAYITKSTPLAKIKEAVQTVANGGAYMSPSIAKKVIGYFKPNPKQSIHNLTPRQEQIVQCLVDGLSYKMIAEKLLISIETVRDHIKKTYKKLEVNSRTEVIKKYLNH